MGFAQNLIGGALLKGGKAVSKEISTFVLGPSTYMNNFMNTKGASARQFFSWTEPGIKAQIKKAVEIVGIQSGRQFVEKAVPFVVGNLVTAGITAAVWPNQQAGNYPYVWNNNKQLTPQQQVAKTTTVLSNQTSFDSTRQMNQAQKAAMIYSAKDKETKKLTKQLLDQQDAIDKMNKNLLNANKMISEQNKRVQRVEKDVDDISTDFYTT